MRKQIEKPELESQILGRAILNSLPDHIAILDASGTILAVNDAWREFALQNDAPSASHAYVGANYLEVCRVATKTGHQAAAQALIGIESVLNCAKDRFVTDYECSSPSKKRWFKMTVVRPKEPAAGLVISHSDITDRKQGEEALRRSEERLRRVTDAVPVLISYVDENQRYRFNNQGYEIWFGHRREYVEGKHLRQVLGEKAYEAIRPQVEAALSGQLITFEDFIPYRGAGRRFVRVHYIPDWQNGKVRGFFALIQDLTMRKQAEVELQAREEEFRSMFELAAVGNAQADPETGRFTRVNTKFCEITGYAEDELLNMTTRDITYPEDRDRDDAEIRKVLAKEAGMWSTEKRYTRKDGRVIWVAVNGTVMRLDGSPHRMVASIVDITERRSYEAALHAHRRALRNLATEISLTQEKERRQIADHLHDHIGQNLVLAKIELGELQTRVPAQHKAAIEKVRSIIDQSLEDTRSLTHDLCPQVLYQLGLEAAIDWLLEQMRAKYSLRCVAEIDPLGRAIADDRRVVLFNALRELLVNVAKHAQATQARIILRSEGALVKLQVADDGCGFEPSALTLPCSTERGFGLFSIRERLAQMGGELQIDSAPGRGTRATVTMPA
jgi:PAS domain S-box-containing protein